LVPPKPGEGDGAAEFEGEHLQLPSACGGDGREGDAAVVGRNARESEMETELGNLALVGAVVVHHPDFFVPLRELMKTMAGFGDALDAATEAKDDFVGEFVAIMRAASVVGAS